MTEPLYDKLGIDYSAVRRPDPRIARRIEAALAGANSVINVGAGTGSYEPRGAGVIAVEPSLKMINQRPPEAARVIQGVAEDLPFKDNEFDAALAVLTVHHWTDLSKGLTEMRRVARRVVIFTWDPAKALDFWLVRDYFPEFAEFDSKRFCPIGFYGDFFGKVRMETVPIPHDCHDGFLCAHWRRPEAYLDETVRQGMSLFLQNDQAIVQRGLAALKADLESGEWHRRNADLLQFEELDLGYRLVIVDCLA